MLANYVQKTVHDVHESKLKAHPELQRKDDVWSYKKRQEFITSLLSGRAYAPIYLVDVEKCLKHSKKRLEEMRSNSKQNHADFQKINDSVVMFESCEEDDLILEGNNRTKTIRMFLDNEIQIPAGTVIRNYKTQNPYQKLQKAMTFEELTTVHPEAHKFEGYLENAQLVNLVYIRSAHWFELESDFINLADGEPQNPMEKLWVRTTPLSRQLRKLSKKFDQRFSDTYGTNKFFKVSRRGDAKLLASAALMFEEGANKDIKMKHVSSFWTRTNPMSPANLKKLQTFAQNLIQLDFDNLTKREKGIKDVPQWTTACMFYATFYLTDKGYEFTSKDSSKIALAILAASHKTYSESKREYAALLAATPEGVEPERKEATFPHYLISNHEVGSSREAFMSTFEKELMNQIGKPEQEQRLTLQE